MQLGAGAAGTCLSHHPEIIILVSVDDMNGRIESFGSEEGSPKIMSLLIKASRVTFLWLIDSSIETLGRKMPTLDE